MESIGMSDLAVPSNGTAPITDLIRARVAAQRLTMPVQGPGTVMMKNITAIPASSDGRGFSVTRLQALDRLIDGIRLSHGGDSDFQDMSEVEKHEMILEETASRIVEDSRRLVPQYGLYRGLVLDMSV